MPRSRRRTRGGRANRRRPAARKATGGPKASPVALELAVAAWRAGFGRVDSDGGWGSSKPKHAANPAEIVQAVAHALAENNGDPHAINDQNSNGSYDYGAWQINSVHTRDGRIRPQNGRFDHRRLVRDVNYNARAAKVVYDERGDFSAWYAPVSGEDRVQAGLAVKQLKLLSPTDASGNFATALEDRAGEIVDNPLSIFEGWADDAIKILLTGALAATGLALFGYGLVKASGAGKVADAAKTAAGAGVPAAVARARGVA